MPVYGHESLECLTERVKLCLIIKATVIILIALPRCVPQVEPLIQNPEMRCYGIPELPFPSGLVFPVFPGLSNKPGIFPESFYRSFKSNKQSIVKLISCRPSAAAAAALFLLSRTNKQQTDISMQRNCPEQQQDKESSIWKTKQEAEREDSGDEIWT